MKEKIEKLEKKFVEMSEKHKFTVYKKWNTNASEPGKDGKPVPVCEFCQGLEGKEVLYNELWSHQAPAGTSPSSGKWYHGLEPGKVHPGCRCSYDVIIK
jgi:hypothetical protein